MYWYDVITDTYVKNAVIGYMQEVPLEVFDIFPKINVKKMEGLIPKYKKADWFKIGTVNDYKRTGATESVGDDFASDKTSYALEQYSFHKDVTKNDREQMESPYEAVTDASKFVVNRIRRVALKSLVDTFLTTGVWGNNEASPTKWDALTSGVSDADPVDQVLGWKQAIEKTTGFDPNKMIVTPDCYKALRLNTKVRDFLGANKDQIVTKQMLAQLFDLEKFIVLNAVNEDVDGYMASGKALLCYTPGQQKASKFEPSAGYIFSYNYGGGMNAQPHRIPMPQQNQSLRIEIDMYMDAVVPAADCGYFISNLVS